MEIGKELNEKVALITGAGSGIGRATALLFAQEGIKVGVNDFGNFSRATSLTDEIRTLGGQAIPLKADIADRDQVNLMIDELVNEFGPVDILVNNAGIHKVVDFVQLSEDEWDRMIAVHLKGMYNCTKAVLPSMIERGRGKVINVASDLGISGGARMTHYCTAKGGMIAFTKALAREVTHLGVGVNAVAPGPIVTEMLTSNPFEFNDEERLKLPSQRFGTPQEVAQSILFLASNAGDFFVGQILGMNGGTVI